MRMVSEKDGQSARVRGGGAQAPDPGIWEETARRYESCHPDDTFSELVRRSSFSKEDRRLLEDWIAVTRAAMRPAHSG